MLWKVEMVSVELRRSRRLRSCQGAEVSKAVRPHEEGQSNIG